MIDEEVRRITGQMYTRTKSILTTRQQDLKRIAAELMRKETLFRADLDRLLGNPQPQHEEESVAAK
jgi:cell division protease FtsH